MKYYKIIVWYNQTKNEFYFKKYKTFCSNYSVGAFNSYGHKVVLIIDLIDLFHKVPLKTRIIKSLINSLQKFL